MVRLSISSLSADGFADNDFVRTFELFPRLGFRHVEFNLWHPSNLTPAKIADLRQRCARSGLQPSAVYSSGFGGNMVKDVAHKIRMMEAARDLGCRRIVACGDKRGDPKAMDQLIRVLKELVPAAEEMDMLVCLENHADNVLENTDDYQRIAEAIPSERVGVCIDTGHFEAAGVDMNDLIDRLGRRVNHIHLKDNKEFGAKRFSRFGEGTVDNHNVIKRMLALGYQGYVNIELSPEVEGATGPLSAEDLLVPRRMFEVYATES
jgi:sugar phosphate isomerase/epimerase